MPETVTEGKAQPVRWASALGAGILAALLYLVPQALALALPVLAVPLIASSLLSPLPLIVARLGRSLAQSIAATGFAALLVLAATREPGAALAFLFMFGGWAVVAGDMLDRRRSLIAMGASGLLVLSVVALALAFLGGQEAVEASLEPEATERITRQWAEASGGDAAAAAAQVARMKKGFTTLFPALAVLGAIVIVLLNTLSIGRILHRRVPGFLSPGELTRLQWPFGLVVAFVSTGALLLVPDLRAVAWNGLVVTLSLFGIQGLSVASFALTRLFAGEFFRLLAMFALLMGPWALLLILVGLFDQWFDFRRLHTPRGDGASPEPGS